MQKTAIKAITIDMFTKRKKEFCKNIISTQKAVRAAVQPN